MEPHEAVPLIDNVSQHLRVSNLHSLYFSLLARV
jgi:hypothetical protein